MRLNPIGNRREGSFGVTIHDSRNVFFTHMESHIFLGHTGSGSFPKTGGKYSTIACFPAEEQTLLFHNTTYDTMVLVTIKFEDGKIFAYDGTGLPVSVGKDGLQAQIGGWTYVNTKKEIAGKVRYVDAVSILQHLEGRMTQLALARRARKLTFEDPRNVRIRQLEADLESCDTACLAAIAERDTWESRAKTMWPIFHLVHTSILRGLLFDRLAKKHDMMDGSGDFAEDTA